MTPRLYWRSRLNDRAMFWAPGNREDYHYIGRLPWPEWVARKALYDDYALWLEAHYPCEDPVGIAPFLRAVAPYIYGPYRNASASSSPVDQSVRYNGNWVRVKARLKYIHMPSYEDACRLWDLKERGAAPYRVNQGDHHEPTTD